jgi:hypothetical protein
VREVIFIEDSLLLEAVANERKAAHDEALSRCRSIVDFVHHTVHQHPMILGLGALSQVSRAIAACGPMVDNANAGARAEFSASLRAFAADLDAPAQLATAQIDEVSVVLRLYGRFADLGGFCEDAKRAVQEGTHERASKLEALREAWPLQMADLRKNWGTFPPDFEKYRKQYERYQTLMKKTAEVADADPEQRSAEETLVLRPYDRESGDQEIRWTMHRRPVATSSAAPSATAGKKPSVGAVPRKAP